MHLLAILTILGFPSLSLSAVWRTSRDESTSPTIYTSTIHGSSTVTIHTTPVVTHTVFITPDAPASRPSTSTIPGSTITIHTTPIITSTVWITPSEPPKTSKVPTSAPSAPTSPPYVPPARPNPPPRPNKAHGLRKCDKSTYQAFGLDKASVKTLDCKHMVAALRDDPFAPKEWFVAAERWQRLLRFRSCEFTVYADDPFHITAQDVTDIVTNTTVIYPGPQLPGPYGRITRCRGHAHNAREPRFQAFGNWTEAITWTLGKGTAQVDDLRYAEESKHHVFPEYCLDGTEKGCLPVGSTPSLL